MLEYPCSFPCPLCPEQPQLVLGPGSVKSVPKPSEKDWIVHGGGEGWEIRMKSATLLVSKM